MHDMAKAPDMIRFAAPTLTGVMPASGVNNTATKITLTGTGFRAGATVTVGGTLCTAVRLVSPTQLTCLAPAKAATCGPQAVIVTNPDKQTAMGNLFAYRAVFVAFGATTNLASTGTGQASVVTADMNGDFATAYPS